MSVVYGKWSWYVVIIYEIIYSNVDIFAELTFCAHGKRDVLVQSKIRVYDDKFHLMYYTFCFRFVRILMHVGQCAEIHTV